MNETCRFLPVLKRTIGGLVSAKPCCLFVGLSLSLSGSTLAQNLFVANGNDNNILEFAPNGTGTTYATGLSNPHGLAFNPMGVLFESDFGSGDILEFNSGGRSPTVFASGLDQPDGMAFNRAGILFVASGGSGRILEFAPNGLQSTFASGLSDPLRLAINSAGDVFTGAGGDILEYSPAGTRSTFATGLTDVRGLAFNSAGDLFEADYESGKVYEFAPNGTPALFASGLDHPFDLVFDSAGTLFVSVGNSSNDGDSIVEFNASRMQNTFASGLTPLGLAFEPVPEPSASSLLVLGASVLFLRLPEPASRCAGRGGRGRSAVL